LTVANKSKEQRLQEVHKEALKRFEEIQSAEDEQRKLAVEDMRFANSESGQWDDDAISKRQDRPRYTINKIAGAIDQLVGDQRQGRTDIKVRPVSGGASEDKANILNGLIRNIEAQSKAANAYDCAFDEQVTGGYGGWRVVTQFNDDDSFDQDIKIKPIQSAATSLWFDRAAKEYDKRDAQYAFLTTEMPKEAFKAKWPKASLSDFDKRQFNNSNCSWFSGDNITVAEYWVKEPMMRRIGLLSDGRVIDLDEEKAVLDDLALQGVTVLKSRSVQSHKVVSYIMNGSEILKGPMEWAGRYIPLIPVYGKVSSIEGKELVRGLVRFAKDPQRVYNYATSANIEAVALTPKDPYWITPTQAKGHETKLRTFNTKNSPFMFYNPDDKAPGPPNRTGAPQVQAALLQQIQQAGMDIHATTGLEPASLGNVPELKSGKAILAQQAMGDRGAYVFTDNLNKSIQYTGDILVDLIPKIYDTPRMVRVLHIDGSSENAPINQQQLDEFGQPVIDNETGELVMVNDITMGKYDVVVDTGPAFHTQRQESAQQLIDLAQASPVFEQVATDLIAKNLNVLESDELTKRVRKQMIGQGIVDPTDDEIEALGLDQPQQPDPMQMALLENVQIQTQKIISDIENKDADTLSKQVKAQQETAKTVDIVVGTMIEKVKAGIPLSDQEVMLAIKQRDILAESQQQVDPGPNSLEAADIAAQIAGANQVLPTQ
jgi:hypothetical protein